jgi:hypothetical protein
MERKQYKPSWRIFVVGGKKRIRRLITATFQRWTCAIRIPALTFIVKVYGCRAKISHSPWYGLSWAPRRVRRKYILLNERELIKLPDRAIIGVIAHELAHIALKHYRMTCEQMSNFYLLFEYEADDLACKWGFKEEVRRFRECISHADESQSRKCIIKHLREYDDLIPDINLFLKRKSNKKRT